MRPHAERAWQKRLAVQAAVFFLAVSASEARAYTDQELQSVRTPQESQLRDLRLAQVAELTALLGRHLPSNRKADFYFRLSELYVELYQAEFLNEGRVYEQKLSAGKSGKLIDRTSSKKFLKKGIQSSKELVDLGIPYEHLDRVYGFLGFYYTQMGDAKSAKDSLKNLVARFPKSEYVAEAQASLGDMSFSAQEYEEAEYYYGLYLKKRAGEQGASIQTPRVLHKLAWARYRMKKYPEAIETMKKAVSLSTGDDKLVNVKEEGLRDLAYFMSEHGDPDEAVRYFQGISGEKIYYMRALERLGREFERTGDADRATKIYENVLANRSDADTRLRVLFRLVDLDLRKRKLGLAAERLEKAEIPQPEGDEGKVAFQNLRAMVRRSATVNHQSWRANQENRAVLATAERFYQLYLDKFLRGEDTSKERSEIEMYLAEVKRDLGKSKEASELYQKVLRSKDERYSKEAGALWVSSLAEAIKKRGKESGKTGQEPSALEVEFVQASDELSRVLPDAQEAREARIQSAQVLAGYSSTQKEALRRTQSIVDEHSDSQQGLTAAKLWLQTITEKLPESPSQAAKQLQTVENLQDAVRALRSNSKLLETDRKIGKGEVRKLLADNESRLEVIHLAELEGDRNYEEAAKYYERLAETNPKSEKGEKAFASAVNNYVLAGRMGDADRVRATWSRAYPGSALLKTSLRASATQQFLVGNYEAAGELFQRLGQSGVDPDALETAARMWEGLEKLDRAVEAWAQFKDRYPSSEKRDAAFLSIGLLEERRGREEAAARAYESCTILRAGRRAECGVRLGELQLRRRENARAQRAFSDVIAVKGKADGRTPFIAYAHYKLAEIMEEGTSFPPLASQKAQLQQALEKRIHFFQKLALLQKEALQSGGPWGIAALFRQAHWLLGFADEIDSLGPEAKSISAPQRKKALATLQDAYRRAVENSILSPATPEIADAIANMRSAPPSRAQGYRGRFRLAGVPAMGGPDGLEGALRKVRARLEKNASDAGAWVDYGNLLWGEGRSMLARIAYERALSLNPKFAYALNNRGVVLLERGGPDDWYRSWEAQSFFQSALDADRYFLASKFNLAALSNYYRLFAKAKPMWEQVLARYNLGDARVGLAISFQGLGNPKQADVEWNKASAAGAREGGFTVSYHRAARLGQKKENSRACRDLLEPFASKDLQGFEKDSVDRLREECEKW